MSSKGLNQLLHLIQGCKRGERNSQKMLYSSFYGYGMSIALRYCKDKEEAVEILNDSFLKVFKGGIQLYNESYNSHEGFFKSWLKRIIINTALDNQRKNQKHYYHQNIEDLNQEKTSFIMPVAIESLSYDEIMILIKELPPAYYTVFCLFVIDGYTHEEIAEKLQIAEGTSKSNLAKARMRLKEMLKKKREDDYAKYTG